MRANSFNFSPKYRLPSGIPNAPLPATEGELREAERQVRAWTPQAERDEQYRPFQRGWEAEVARVTASLEYWKQHDPTLSAHE